MGVVDHDAEDSDNSKEKCEEEIKKRANWVERLMEIRSHWRRRQQEPQDEKDGDFDEIEVIDEGEIDGCDCDGCEVSYSSEEEAEEEEKRPLDRESFSRFLMAVPWSDTKLFSQLAFLCNIAYVIQDIRVISVSLLIYLFLRET